MSGPLATTAPRVIVVGGGLAGLAAAVALSTAGCHVELLEARSYLGGRAASFRDAASGELIDHCQHVGMGCCTNLADFCRRTGVADCLRHDSVLHFIGPDGRQYDFRPTPWLPAPLHLAPAFWGLKYLSIWERMAIGRALWKLMRLRPGRDLESRTIGDWLAEQRQPSGAIERFWGVILISALGESLQRASLLAARKVIVDGFLAAADASTIDVPRVPLGMLYGQRMESWMARHGVTLRLNSPVRQILRPSGELVVRRDTGDTRPDFVVVAVPWSKLRDLIEPELRGQLAALNAVDEIESSPITGVHLWFDRPIMSLPHAVLIDRLGQWVFHRSDEANSSYAVGHYYQVVISASRNLAGRDRQQIVDAVCGELAEIWPAARGAKLLQARVVTDQDAVFSVRPGLDDRRPPQQTPIHGLLLAGDWTSTSWPATMESAVRSGYLAAESILHSMGRNDRFVVPDLPRGWLARLLIASG
jgi:squalene-associated FAD-dependent desaturase